MSTRCKFTVNQVDNYGDSVRVQASVVADGSEEDKTFWKYTPAGHLDITISNPAVMDFFVLGQKYYVDISPADE